MAIKYYKILRLLIPSNNMFDSGAERCFLLFPFCFWRSPALWCSCGIVKPSSRPTQNSAFISPPLLPLWVPPPAPSSCVQTLKSPPALTVLLPFQSDCCFHSLSSWILVHTGARVALPGRIWLSFHGNNRVCSQMSCGACLFLAPKHCLHSPLWAELGQETMWWFQRPHWTTAFLWKCPLLAGNWHPPQLILIL